MTLISSLELSSLVNGLDSILNCSIGIGSNGGIQMLQFTLEYHQKNVWSTSNIEEKKCN